MNYLKSQICDEMLRSGCSLAVVQSAKGLSVAWEGLRDLMQLWMEAHQTKDLKEALACYMAIMTAIIEVDYYSKDTFTKENAK